MAPPSPRRPGFSRRAQYGIFASYVIAVFGAAFALLLVLTARFDPDGHSALQSILADVTSPVSAAGRTALTAVGDVGESIGAYVDAAAKNKAMSRELAAARKKLIEADVLRVENRRLKQLLGMSADTAPPVARAALVSSTGSSSRRYATLSAGAADGVANGQPVLGPDGLIGRVVSVGRVSARVLLIVDAGNVTPVKRTLDGAPALAMGSGDGRLILRPLTSGVQFKPGDLFVTSGSGGIYRPGIPVARAIDRGREGTKARPMADPARLDFAVVEPVFQMRPPPAPSQVGEPKED
ncbi:MAG: rod shape-determining protein MreC [Chakrabartia godavariana]